MILPKQRPRPGGVLALDLSGITGWCYIGLTDACGLRAGLWVLPKRAISAGRQGCALENEITDAINTWEPKMLLMEAPPPAHGGGTNAQAIYQQFGLAQVVENTAYRNDIECRMEYPQTVRAKVMGRGHGTMSSKDKMGGAIQRWLLAHFDVETPDHNVADAVLLALHGARVKGRPLEP